MVKRAVPADEKSWKLTSPPTVLGVGGVPAPVVTVKEAEPAVDVS